MVADIIKIVTYFIKTSLKTQKLLKELGDYGIYW